MTIKKLVIGTLIAAAPVCASAFTRAQAAADDDANAKNDSTGFIFTDIKVIPTTPVKDQNKSGTCWCFAGTSFIEEAILRQGGPELDLSEMYTVRFAYIEKAIKYVRTGGHINFAQGGAATDVPDLMLRYGAVPEEVYSGLNYGEKKHAHYEMYDALKGYLDGILKNANKHLSASWLKGFTAILDSYLGEIPQKFTYQGKTYTPQEFAKAYGIDKIAKQCVNITSYTHHPFYTKFAVEIPDNWTWSESYNVPLNELKDIIDASINDGYTVCWAADVSERGFKWWDGFAVLPAEKEESDMTNAEVARWSKMTNTEREAQRNKINGPGEEVKVTQESRQAGFDNFDTTDDHGMVIVGIAKDQNGNIYYKVKNSWNTNQRYDGFFYVSEAYLLDKTISVMVDRNAVPKAIAKKIF
ncbi:MAG: aminopeptidase [Prevotella sp.]|nr:aminopeptidase [Bacteroides sp.]MCM1366934.1 aminopeptidase [Prevotella sp.]MCM1437465.1 aminopeptidase [Prevotella sp.]